MTLVDRPRSAFVSAGNRRRIAAAVYAAGFLAVGLLKAVTRLGHRKTPAPINGRTWTLTAFLPGFLLGAVVQWSGLNWLGFHWRGEAVPESIQMILLVLAGSMAALMISVAGSRSDPPARAGVSEDPGK